jgi:hypothetical protein
MGYYSKAPLGDGALSKLTIGDVGNDAVAASYYSTCAPPGLPQRHCSPLVTWLRCQSCCWGYFTTSALVLQLCPACAGDRLQPLGLWDLTHEAAPDGIRQRSEVSHAYLG